MNKLFVANWKMNGNTDKVIVDLKAYIANAYTNCANVIFALPYVYLPIANYIIRESDAKLRLATQDISKFSGSGAYTGEISNKMLGDLQINYVIIGHSERRMYFNEDDSVLFAKLNNAIAEGIRPIYCMGEALEVRKSGEYLNHFTTQLQLLQKVEALPNELIIAYEPIWSIGTGLIPKVEEIKEAMDLIHTFVQNNLPHVKITALYGGSVSSANIAEILQIQGVNGVLVGGASLKVNDFTTICGGG